MFHAGNTQIRGAQHVRGKGQYRIQPIQRLNGGLFIYAEHRCMSGRTEVQADDIGRLKLKIRIVAGHVTFQPMRLQPSLFPGAMDSVFANTQGCRKLAATPVCRPIDRPLARSRQNPGPQGRSKNAGRLARMTSIKSIHAAIEKPRFPPADGRRRRVQLSLDGVERRTFSKHQDQSSAKHVSSGQRTGLCDTAQLSTLLLAQHNIIGWHEDFDA
jgi:hypothetical protein